jgi:sigma-B regulation protein RsbU (phosphoserine phosphatase)
MAHAFHHEGEDETTHFLLEIAEAANAPLDLDQLLARIGAVVKKAIDYQIFAIMLLNDRAQELRVRYSVGFTGDAKSLRVKVGRGVTGTAAATRKPVVVEDVSQFPAYIPAVEGIQSEVAVPMILQDRVVGVIDIQSREKNYFSDGRKVELVELIAGRVALSVENARLYRSTARQAKTLTTLVEIAHEFTGILRVEELLPKLAEAVRRLIGYDGFSIMRMDQERQVLYHYFGMVFDQRVKERGVIPLGKGICGIAASHKESLLVPDVTKDLRYINMNPATRSELSVPLVVKDEVIGVLDLESTRKGFFTPRHQQMMELLAPQVAIALENARLYEKIAKEEARLERDLDAARTLQSYLMPACCPDLPGLQMSAHYEPAREIGGDFYDFMVHNGPDGKPQGLVLFTGDVSGKGAAAALYAAMVIGALRNVAQQHLSPGEMLLALNEILLQRRAESRYVALSCAYFDLESRTLEMANAGLNLPVLCRGGQILDVHVEGVPLGLLEDVEYETVLVMLEPGDTVVFCSDGITDNLNPAREDFGTQRLKDLVLANCNLPTSEMVEMIFEHVNAWAHGRPAFDDQTVVALKVV